MKTNKKRTTQKEIARLAEIGPDFLSHIIRGRRPCPPPVAVRLEAVTAISRVTGGWGSPEEIRKAVEDFIYQGRADYGHR
jgi:DNA-binding transcriptional regulator YdaS (Cro superfamily)